jgi:hypothetical protein
VATEPVPGSVPLNPSARRGLAIRLNAIIDQVDAIARLGIDEPDIDMLQRSVFELMEELALTVNSPPPPDPVGMMIRVFILLDEISPNHLTAYGPLDPRAAAFLEQRVGALYSAAETLQNELRSRRDAEGGQPSEGD